MKSHVERAITIGFALALLFIIATGGAAYRIILRVENAAVERARTGQTRLGLATLLSQLQDAELDEHSYIITGDKGNLESYNATVSAISQTMTELRQLMADNPLELQKLEQLTLLIQSRLAKLQQAIDLRQGLGFEAAAAFVHTDLGDSSMDPVRQGIDGLRTAEDAEYAQREAALSNEIQTTQKVMLLGGLLAFGVLVIAGVIIRRGLLERKQAEKRILRLNQLYATLSQINQTIVRVREPKALFEEICRVAIEQGQFRMAWIGLIDETSGLVKPAAFAGEERSYLENISIKYQDESLGRGPVGTAIREGRCIICQEIASDPRMEPWRERALQRGYRSLAAVPIRQQGRVIGALAVYSAETRGFDPEDEKLLDEIGLDISFALDSIKAGEEHRQAEEMLSRSESKYRTLIEQLPIVIYMNSVGNPTSILYISQQIKAMSGYSPEEWQENTKLWEKTVYPMDYQDVVAEAAHMHLTGEPFDMEYRLIARDGRVFWVRDQVVLIRDSEDKPQYWQGFMIDITERKRAEDALVKNEKRFRALIENGVDYISLLAADGSLLWESPSADRMLDYAENEFLGSSIMQLIHPEDLSWVQERFTRLAQTPASQERAAFRLRHRDGSWRWIEAVVTNLLNEPSVEAIVINYHDITDRKRAEARIQQQLDRLRALSEIDRIISSSFDLRRNLDTLLAHTTSQLGVDAAAVLILNPDRHELDYKAGRGFYTPSIETAKVRLGESYAGRVALERRMIQIANLDSQSDNPLLTKYLAGEDFVAYFGAPLIVKGKIKGVLEIFNRSPLEPDSEWLDFFNTLAGQAAIAIDNATLFENLQRTNIDLTLAYDATIEGWSHAMDLRDKETEGHTQRVTETSVELARRLGIQDDELMRLRWGALLHDIGKMGIPDGILLKPGTLTDEEWVVMKKHPSLAYKMLAPIQYLKDSLDIPYCHHEKWDGTGYPRGLKGEQIPLSARIFAVIDVWDALTSDRVYRKAWTEEKARDYIKSQAGIHFDPHIVKVCFESGVLERKNQK